MEETNTTITTTDANTYTEPNLVKQDIVSELKQSYIDYAMSVIVSRALPDVRDGLKPVQRRIMYSMYSSGILPSTPYKKVARIVGDVMGKYHPHGDASVADALVRMAQDFSMRYTLVDGQGNYGSIDGDPPAAMRYIEARLEKLGHEMLKGVEETVDFGPNYDGNEIEPQVLPAAVPNLLLNGGEGIAVGMATKIPPHNLNELVGALVKMVDSGNKWDFNELNDAKVDYKEALKRRGGIANLPKNRFHRFNTQLEVKDLLTEIKGPDFPTGGHIYNAKSISTVYETGRGAVLMRGVSEIEEIKGGKFRIIITQLPYQVNKAMLITKIAQLYKDKKIEGISDLRDESNKQGIRIVIELKKDAKPKTVQNQLYKYTELQKNFNVNMLALVNNEPRLLSIKEVLELFLTHRQEIVIRRSEYDLAKTREREHILAGLMIALDHLDEVINLIRRSKDADTAKSELMSQFKLSDVQAQAILDMQLRRLAALERQKIEDEYNEVLKRIEDLLFILNTPSKVLEIIKAELLDVKERFGDNRKTRVFKGDVDEFSEEDLISKEQTFVTISAQGYIKRVKEDTYKAQKRGGVGVKAATTKDEDSVRHVFSCSTHDEILFFSNLGKVYSLKVYDIPEASRIAKGIPLVNLANLSQGELITSVLTRSSSGAILDEEILQEGEEKKESQGKNYNYLFMATKKGTVKKTEIKEFDNIRSNGLIAIALTSDDELIWVKPTTGESEIILVTKEAKSIHFKEEDVRETGRASQGVRGIKLKSSDEVISMDVVRSKEEFMLTISENGFGKITKLEQFTVQNRGGSGIFAAKVNSKTGNLVIARILDHPQKELLIMSAKGQAVRIPTNELPLRNRQTSGVTLMRVKDGDKVTAATII